MSLQLKHVELLAKTVASGTRRDAALAETIGGRDVCGGFWRFYSTSWPVGGAHQWNVFIQETWREFLPPGLWSFGEDILGNQLVLMPDDPYVFLWNHENGELNDLSVGPFDLLSCVIENGVAWVDFYHGEQFEVCKCLAPFSRDMHLHWVTPLVLGGAINVQNLQSLERDLHIKGHAELWSQIYDLPPGAQIELG